MELEPFFIMMLKIVHQKLGESPMGEDSRSDIKHFAGVLVVDLTRSQFPKPIDYQDLPATRQEAMAAVTPAEYDALRRRFLTAIDK